MQDRKRWLVHVYQESSFLTFGVPVGLKNRRQGVTVCGVTKEGRWAGR